jgi:hypothetical protein
MLAYVHSTYYAPIRLIIYLVVFGVVAVIGAIARSSRRKNMSRYGQPPQQGWQQTAPPPGSPYGAWGNQPPPGPPQQGYQQQPYPGYPPAGQPGHGQAPPPPPPGYGQPPPPGYQQPPW